MSDESRPPEFKSDFTLPTLTEIGKPYYHWERDEINSQLPSDILLLTANDHEFNACYSYMTPVRRSYHQDLGYVDFGRFGEQNVKVALIKCEQGSSKIQTAVSNAARILQPKVALSVGLCATMKPEKAKLGDVVISAKLATFDDKKVREDGTDEWRGIKMNVSRNMAYLILSAADGWQPPLKDPNSFKVEVHRDAVMLSGPELVNNLKRRQKLLKDFPDALGLEMEGKGLYEAARDLGIEWAVIKGVSNFADGSEEDTKIWQPFASAMAASVVHNMFKHPTVIEHWPRHKKTEDAKGPTSKVAVSNYYEFLPVQSYCARKEIDDEIQKIQKGKPKTLHGTIGTGKTFAALHYVDVNKNKFGIRWCIDVSKGQNSIIALLTDLAKGLGVSYKTLFQTIEQKAESEDIVFVLDNVEKKPSDKWFKELWNIQSSIYIIITTNNTSPSLDLPGAEELQVEKFDEALEFLEEIPAGNSEEDLLDLCDHFGWNILGLTAAKWYMLKTKITARTYLQRQKKAAKTVRQIELNNHDRTLYESVRACLEEVDSDKFSAIATITVISSNTIPEFLLSNQLCSSNHCENEADLDDLHDELKSLVHITNENGIRFFSFHSFTQYVIEDMIDESVKADLLYKLAGIFVRYISKDNRYSKDYFLQHTVRKHAERFLKECGVKQESSKQDKQEWGKDDRTSIALARLSELVGFTYTQQQSTSEHELDVHFTCARDLLHTVCGITDEDLQPADELVISGSSLGNSSDRETYSITNNDLAVAHQLFTKLTKKSSELSPSIIEELVFSRAVNKQDLAVFPEPVRENKTLKEKIKFSHPLSPSDVKVFVNHGAAYSVDAYREMFLPELYLSMIYSFGRNYFYYFYSNRETRTTKQPNFYIDLLKLAYCLSLEISKGMKPNEAVFHEYLVQSNALLYLLVNDDYIFEDGTHMKKEDHVHAKDLKNAIDRYQQLIHEERRFFEMGMLKKTKGCKYSTLVCDQQILKCYDSMLSLESIEDRKEYIKDGVQLCDDLLELLNTKDDLVRYPRHLNAIAEFYLRINHEEYYSRAIKIFTNSAEQAEKNDVTLFYLEALVGLADVFSRIGIHRFSATHISIRHLKQCDSKESLREMQRKNLHIQERICRIQKQNLAMVLKHCAQLRRRNERGEVCNDGPTDNKFERGGAKISGEEISSYPW